MKIIEWEKNYELGVESLDKEHKQLFSIINKLLVLIEDEEKSERAFQESIKYLKNHTIEHFTHEEEYMLSQNYAYYDIHKRLHDNFRKNTLPALESELQEMHYSDSAVRHFMGVVIGWLVGHTKTEDMAIVGKNKNRWNEIPPEKEMDFLEQIVVQTFLDMFRLNPKTISVNYEGENFGSMITICFIYRGKADESWEIVLSYEEKLLLKLVGRLLNTEYRKCDDMILNITRYISRQFMERIRESFPALETFELESESLLTYEQLTKTYKESQPACSLLFDTGEGYFAFSVGSTDTMCGKIYSAVNEENVTSEIWKCLNSGKNKKKILVVDDSDFMRQIMVNLLKDDYDVLESDSGLSAIKKLTINKPDLMLLDYDMPVCDGRQILEMLRSDADTADTAVIFLTGRSDQESIKKVMELKPSGYLLKMMPRENIKKAIDGFFAHENGK